MQDQDLLQVPSFISKVTTMADKSLRLQVDTQELTPEASMKVFACHNVFGSFVFVKGESDIDVNQVKIPEYHPVEKTDKSPSKRLRSVLFIQWQQKKIAEPFDDYYRKQMEIIIDHFKSKLDET